ncbi:unnamed protein product [Rangifer tarandus platyrhynchus]|uniref:Uncharacterized protein n=1 Tax=Rangifer tarandus platyrhynchus TaxID=3082113 RepID=A0AC60A7B1_RANTA
MPPARSQASQVAEFSRTACSLQPAPRDPPRPEPPRAGPRRCREGTQGPSGLAPKLFGPEMEVRSEFPSPLRQRRLRRLPSLSSPQPNSSNRRVAEPVLPPRAPGSFFFGEILPAAPSRDPRPSPRPARAS